MSDFYAVSPLCSVYFSLEDLKKDVQNTTDNTLLFIVATLSLACVPRRHKAATSCCMTGESLAQRLSIGTVDIEGRLSAEFCDTLLFISCQ